MMTSGYQVADKEDQDILVLLDDQVIIENNNVLLNLENLQVFLYNYSINVKEGYL